jgi:hypothetical protein
MVRESGLDSRHGQEFYSLPVKTGCRGKDASNRIFTPFRRLQERLLKQAEEEIQLDGAKTEMQAENCYGIRMKLSAEWARQVRHDTRWFNYDRDDLYVNKSQFVPVIFEPPSICRSLVTKTTAF